MAMTPKQQIFSDIGQWLPDILKQSEEVCHIRTSAPIQIIMYYPETEEGKRKLQQRVADVHADLVVSRIQKLNCPTEQKLELLDAVIQTAAREKTDDNAAD